MRISDWSSDVCSSDLNPPFRALIDAKHRLNLHRVPQDRVRRLAGNPRDIIGVGDFRGGDRGGIVERAEQQRGPEAFPKEVLHAACHTRSEEHTSELQSLMRISYAVFCLKKKK